VLFVAFDFRKLRGRIIELYGTCANFAGVMERSNGWLSVRLNNVVPWQPDEMIAAARLLNISAEEIHVFFLTPKFD
jgi:hypothetical protein